MGKRRDIIQLVGDIHDDLRMLYHKLEELQTLVIDAEGGLPVEEEYPRVHDSIIGALEAFHEGSIKVQRTFLDIKSLTSTLKLCAKLKKVES